ncbi:MAG: KilA-N domain-containing protein [Prevotellaceae bacterium]|nr:KilA-N domain-containing protein [Prevotellaceae bacterium]
MAKKQTIHINGSDIIVLKQQAEDYISLTDMAKYKNAEATGVVISHWLSTRYALDYLGIFERLNNPNFNVTEFGNIRAEAGSNGFVLTVKQWVERTNAIGIISTPGRYGGTYAHRDIALEFASWLSAELKYYMVRELQRLKADENDRLQLNWTLQRTLSKINYRIHTDAIKDVLLPPEVTRERANFKYASEADLLNVALFGQTAREWRETYPNEKGNIRDNATLEQLVVLSNLESINSILIRQGISASERLTQLNQIARTQIQSLLDNAAMKQLRELPGADDLPQLPD